MLDKSDEVFEPYSRSVPRTPLRRAAEEFLLAITLLTRIPVPRFKVLTKADHGSAFWAYPIIGALVGAIGGAAFVAGIMVGLGALASSVLALGAMAMATGAFHEDALADFADGIGGGQTRQSKLEIMHDSRLGTYGALALFLVIMFEIALLVELSQSPAQLTLGGMFSVFVCVGAIQRAAIGLPLAVLAPARTDGLSAHTTRPRPHVLAFAVFIALLLSAFLLGPAASFAAFAGALAAALVVTKLAARHLGGRTGDVLGATAVLAGAATLAALVIVAKLQAGS
jgi:adenosylcobinamide-GDP ribazoletransferase